ELRDRAEERPRLRGDSLRVLQVARVLEGDPERQRRAWRAVRGGEELGDVGDREVETGVLQVRPAPRGVRHDRLCARGAELGGDAVRHREPLLAAPRMERERAAAAGVRCGDLVAVRREDARGRAVDLAEEDALHAAGEEADTAGL